MDWHSRYLQQAAWTRDLRDYLLVKAGIDQAQRLLEVACGTGAVLIDLAQRAGHGRTDHLSDYGLDIQTHALLGARKHAPGAALTQGDAHRLPFANGSFEITCCHFALLWLADPLLAVGEMRRVTCHGGHVLAMAEPDYTRRVDRPAALATLGTWQQQALIAQGADPSIGSRIAGLFGRAGLTIVETGTIKARDPGDYGESDWKAEWAVLRQDLSGRVTDAELDRLEQLDQKARRAGKRKMYVPTYFVHAQV